MCICVSVRARVCVYACICERVFSFICYICNLHNYICTYIYVYIHIDINICTICYNKHTYISIMTRKSAYLCASVCK